MSTPKTYGGFVRDYDPRKPDMHSIFRAEDDTRTLSPEMDAWRSRQIAKRCVCGKPAERHTDDGVGLCKECFDEVPKCACADPLKQQVCDACQGTGGLDVLPNT